MVGKLSLPSAELRGFREGFDPSETSKALPTMHKWSCGFHPLKNSGTSSFFILVSHSGIMPVGGSSACAGRHGRRNDRARLTYQATCSQFQHRDGHVDPRCISAALALYGRTGSGFNGPG